MRGPVEHRVLGPARSGFCGVGRVMAAAASSGWPRPSGLTAACVGVAAFAVALFASTFRAEFVWDDRAAVLTNADLRPTSPWSDLLKHDFWGQNITDE